MTSRRSVALALGVVSTVVIAAVTLAPSPQFVMYDVFCIFCGDFGGLDFLLNVALFVPLGASLGIGRVRITRVVASVALATIAIETLQLVVIRGRDASVGDVLANATGGALGFLLGTHLEALIWPGSIQAVRLLLGATSVWLVAQTISSYALVPIPSQETHYGLLARRVRGSPPFTGRILGLTVDGRAIPNGQLVDQQWVRRAMLGRGGTGAAQITFTPGTLYDNVSPIARIGDEVGADVLFIGALRSDVVFGVRTGATALRLRPPRFRLENLLPVSRPDDTVRADFHYAPPTVTLVARQPFKDPPITIPLTAAQGWRLVLPWQSYAQGSTEDALYNAAWLFTLLLPTGYWAAFAAERRRWLIAVGVTASVAVGLMIGAVWFGLSGPHWSEASAAATSVAAGAALANLARGMRGQRHREADP